MVYVGDVSHASYGDRSPDEVIACSMRIAEWLVARSAIMTVVACNTATVLAIGALRARRPELVFVGVEPGVKPAAVQSRTRRIAVLATVATANSERLRGSLISLCAKDAHIHFQPCPGLAAETLLAIVRRVVNAARAQHQCETATMQLLLTQCTCLQHITAEVLTIITATRPG